MWRFRLKLPLSAAFMRRSNFCGLYLSLSLEWSVIYDSCCLGFSWNFPGSHSFFFFFIPSFIHSFNCTSRIFIKYPRKLFPDRILNSIIILIIQETNNCTVVGLNNLWIPWGCRGSKAIRKHLVFQTFFKLYNCLSGESIYTRNYDTIF